MKRWLMLLITSLLILPGLAFAQDEDPDENAPDARPWLGVQIAQDEAGVRVVEVVPDSPAEAAGIAPEDVITAVNGESVTAPADLADSIGALQPGDSVTLSIQRGEESLDVEVTLGVQPEEMMQGGRPDNRFGMPPNMEFNLTIPTLIQLEEAAEGWRVVEAPEGVDVLAGDIITAVNGEAVAEMDFPASGVLELSLMPDMRAPGDWQTIELDILRDGEAQTLSLNLTDIATIMPMMEDFDFPMMGAYLGVRYSDTPDGAQVEEVVADSPAEQAGLQVGDVVTAVDDTPLGEETTLRALISEYAAGDTVTLAVNRGAESLQIEVTLGENPQPIIIRPGEGGGLPFEAVPFEGMPGDRFGRGFEFNFTLPEGEALQALLDALQATEGEAFTLTCTNSAGDTVLTLNFDAEGESTLSVNPTGGMGFELDELACEVAQPE